MKSVVSVVIGYGLLRFSTYSLVCKNVDSDRQLLSDVKGALHGFSTIVTHLGR